MNCFNDGFLKPIQDNGMKGIDKKNLVANLNTRGKNVTVQNSIPSLVAQSVIDPNCIASNLLSGAVVDGVSGTVTIGTLGGRRCYIVNLNNGGGTGAVLIGTTLNYNCGFTPSTILISSTIANAAGLTSYISINTASIPQFNTSGSSNLGGINIGGTQVSSGGTEGTGIGVGAFTSTGFSILLGSGSGYYWNNVYTTAIKITAVE